MPISLSLIYCFKFCSNISTSLLTYIFTILSSFFSSSYPFYQYLLLFRLLPSSSIISFLILIIIPLITLLFLFILFVSCTFHTYFLKNLSFIFVYPFSSIHVFINIIVSHFFSFNQKSLFLFPSFTMF